MKQFAVIHKSSKTIIEDTVSSNSATSVAKALEVLGLLDRGWDNAKKYYCLARVDVKIELVKELEV